MLSNLVRTHRRQILDVALSHGAVDVKVFGSMVSGVDLPESDLDLLVTLRPGASLLDLVAIKQDVEEMLNRKVDVVTESSLSPYIRDRVMREAESL